MLIIGLLGIIFSVVLLIFLAYKGVPTLICAPICAMLMALINQLPILDTFNEVYVVGVVGYVKVMFGIVVMGSLIAEFYNRSGAASSIANAIYNGLTYKARKNTNGEEVALKPVLAILVVFVIGLSLSFAGISPIVLMLIIFPIALDVFEKANMPRFMAPGVVLGALATASSSMPGTASDPNIITGQILGTGPMSAAIPGFIGGVLVIGLNLWMLNICAKKEVAKGHTYSPPRELLNIPKFEKKPHWAVALIPLVSTVICYNALKLNILVVLAISLVECLVLFWKYYGRLQGLITLCTASVVPALQLLFAVGVLGSIGNVIAATPVFPHIASALLGLQVPSLFKAMIVVMIMTAFTGSGPAGLMAALPNFSDAFHALGINFSALHRVSTFASQTLDTLPTNPGYAAATGIVDVTIKDSYKFVFISTVLNTTITAIVVTLILTLFPGLA